MATIQEQLRTGLPLLTIGYLVGTTVTQLRIEGWPVDGFPTALALIPVAILWLFLGRFLKGLGECGR